VSVWQIMLGTCFTAYIGFSRTKLRPRLFADPALGPYTHIRNNYWLTRFQEGSCLKPSSVIPRLLRPFVSSVRSVSSGAVGALARPLGRAGVSGEA